MSLAKTLLQLRTENANALLEVLNCSGDLSESSIHNSWLKKLSQQRNILCAGWYVPPPGGSSVLLGNAPEYNRNRFHSLRDQEKWPRKDIHFSNDSMLYAYASPVSKESYLLGDMAVTLCKTNSQEMREYICAIFSLTILIAKEIREGMQFAEVYRNADSLIRANGFTNHVYSRTDPCHVDIGHTLPWSNGELPSPAEREILEGDSPEDIANLISSKRTFVNAESSLVIRSPMAFTVEPRLNRDNLVPISFHLTVVLENGQLFVISGFKPLLNLFEMTEWLPRKNIEQLDAL